MVVICFSDFSCSKVCDVAYDFQHATHIGDHCIFLIFCTFGGRYALKLWNRMVSREVLLWLEL